MIHRYAAALAALTVAPALAADKPGITGRWVNEDGRAVVEFTPCGAKMCGHIERFLVAEPKGGARDTKNPDRAKRDRRLLGSQVFWGLSRDGATWNGQGYMPEHGRNFKAHLTPQGNRMKLRGCVAVFCKTVYWKRAN